MKYTNTQQFNLGLKFMTGDPADDRLILNSSADMFVNKNNTTEANSPLFNRAYAGMIVTVANEGYETYVCINDAPYKAKTKADVTAANLTTYWKRGDLTLYNYVHTEVDNYICTPHIKVNSEWIACTSTLSTTGIKGINYVFDASIDSNTLEVHSNKLSGWKFKLDKVSEPGDANYAEYQLKFWAPGATDWANDPTKIEIPKLLVLKSVRLCVAVPDRSAMGGYKVATITIDGQVHEVYRDDPDITEARWQQTAADAEAQGGGVFLRIEWDNDDTPPATDITFINVGEIITIDIEPLRQRLDSLESRGRIWDSSINDLERRARIVDISTNALETSVYTYLPPVINNINSSISSLKANDTSIVNYINNDLSVYMHSEIDDLSAYIINTVVKNINSSISSLKANDTSIVNYINNDLSVYIHSEIENVSDYIINTVIGEGGTGLTKRIDDIDSSVRRLNSSVNELESSVYTYLPPVLEGLRNDIDNVDVIIDERVNPRIEALEDVIYTFDSSIKELYANNIEIIGAWAAAWNALFDANPTLRKPASPVDPDPQYQDLTDSEFSYSSATATAAEMGTLQGAPTLTNTHNLAVTYNSTNPSVATVSSNGTVNVVNSTGSTIILAVFAGDNTYNAKTVSYTLTILSPDPSVNYYLFAKNYQQLENPEFISVIVDDADHVLYGKKTDGTVYNSNLSTSVTMTVDNVTQPVPVICAALKDATAEDLSTHGVPDVTPSSGE